MKKNLPAVLLFAVHVFSAQIISTDNSFATNGIYATPATNNTNDRSKMVQAADGSIYYTYNRNDSSTGGLEKSFISRLTANGTTDLSFGNSGKAELPALTVDSQLTLQPDGKLIMLCSSTDGPVIYRMLQNGQPDSSFGVNGSSTVITALGVDNNGSSYGIILQNGKIIVYGVDSSVTPLQHRIYRLNADGSQDTGFGNNGSVFTQGNWSNLTSVFVDNQSNIVCGHANGIMEKFSSQGQPLTGFGNNGILQTVYRSGGIMDSSNRILVPDLVGQISRFSPDGAPDPSFHFNPVGSLPFSIMILSIKEKNGYYYIGGMAEDNGSRYFISRLSQNGTIDPGFGYYTEAHPDLGIVWEMIVNDGYLLANGSNRIVKYLLNNSALSASELSESGPTLAFENPVKHSLNYQSKEKPSRIEIYNAAGILMKTLKDGQTDVSELPTGIYMARFIFGNKKTWTKKFIKQ